MHNYVTCLQVTFMQQIWYVEGRMPKKMQFLHPSYQLAIPAKQVQGQGEVEEVEGVGLYLQQSQEGKFWWNPEQIDLMIMMKTK